MLQKQGWKDIVALSFPQAVLPTKAQPSDLKNHYTLQDSKESTLRSLINEIKDAVGPIKSFFHVHPTTKAKLKIQQPFADQDKEIIKIVYFLAKHLKKDLVQKAFEERNCFFALTRLNGQLGFGETDAQNLVAGGLCGLIKTANIEWENVFCRVVDFDNKLTEKDITDLLEREIYDPNTKLHEVGYGTNGRNTLTAEVENLEDENFGATSTNKDSVFLVSGGAKGVTAKCIKELAKRFQPTFILFGRSDNANQETEWSKNVQDETELKKRCMEAFLSEGQKPTPVKIGERLRPILAQREINQTISELETYGSRVEYISADVLEIKSLKQKIASVVEKTGPITGIVHGAGVLADKLIEAKTEEDYQAVISTKIDGLHSVLQCINPANIQHLILFSSAAGFYGNEAQSDYAVANEILNKFANQFKRTYPNCHVISLNWGPWDGGMVSPHLKRLFEERNIAVIPPEVGSAMMSEELTNLEKSYSQIVVGSSMVVPKTPNPNPVSFKISRVLNPTANLFLNDHVIGDEPVLPMVSALSWMADSSEQLYPGYKVISSSNSSVLKGIIFKSQKELPVQVKIEQAAIDAHENVQIKVTIFSDLKGKPVYHYRTDLVLSKSRQVPPIFQNMDVTAGESKGGAEFYTDGTLFHGPLFQCIQRQLNITDQSVTIECCVNKVDRLTQGQFPTNSFNYFALDAQMQAMLVWARWKFNAGSLPLKIEKVQFYREIPFDTQFYVTLNVLSSSSTKLNTEITSYDRSGLIYNQLSGAEVTISKALNDKFLK